MYVNIHISFTLNLAVTKKTVGGGEKLLTYLNLALKVLLGLDIFPRVPKKKFNFFVQCYQRFLIYFWKMFL
jgi:hypothetical protein